MKNESGKLLKTQININQLKPYHCYPPSISGTSDHYCNKCYHTCSSFNLDTITHLHGVEPSEDSSRIKSSKKRKNSKGITSLLLPSGYSTLDSLYSIPPSKKPKKIHEIEPYHRNNCTYRIILL